MPHNAAMSTTKYGIACQMLYSKSSSAACGHDRHRDEDAERDERRRQGDAEVVEELILHVDALRAGCRDRGVRNEREVVAEHRAADDGSHAQRQIEARAGGDGHGDGGEHRDGADARSHGKRDDAGDDEKAGNGRLGGQYVEQQVCRALRATGCARNAGERARPSGR